MGTMQNSFACIFHAGGFREEMHFFFPLLWTFSLKTHEITFIEIYQRSMKLKENKIKPTNASSEQAGISWQEN